MAAMTVPGVKPARNYDRIPAEVKDAVLDAMEARATGVVEIHVEVHLAQGGVAKVYSTTKKTYK